MSGGWKSLYDPDRKDPYRSLLLLTLSLFACGALALPMLPVWQGGVRVLAGIVLLFGLSSTICRRLLGLLLAGLLLSSAGAWLRALTLAPAGHVIHALTDVYGLVLGIVPDGLLLFYDIICVVGLTSLIVGAHWRTDRLLTIFAGAAALFWLWGLLTPLAHAAAGADATRLAQMVTGLSGWATWVYWALLPLLLVRDETDVRKLLTGIGVGGLFVGSVVGLQWILHDFSYVLDSSDLTSYFYRVRGTDYYHAAASFALIFSAITLLALRCRDGKPVWVSPTVVLMLAMAVYNGTRALNLALLVSLCIMLVGTLRQRCWGLTIVTLAGFVALSSHILYIKPGAGEASGRFRSEGPTIAYPGKVAQDTGKFVEKDNPEAKKQRTNQPRAQTSVVTGKPTVADVIAANSSRALLAKTGLAMLPSAKLVGHGVGTLDIPLEGNTFNGISSTYSSHILYMDIALMAGWPTLILAGVFFSIAVWRSTHASMVRVGSGPAPRALALLSVLIVFAVASLFLPQERNELVGMAFLIASLAMLQPLRGPVTAPACDISAFGRNMGFISIGAGVAGWAVLTSPVYLFPAIEFVARHGREVGQKDQRVLVTDPVMKPLLEFLLRLRGATASRVSVLSDYPSQLLESNAWLLWNPARDKKYPQLRQYYGYQGFELRQGGQTPSIALPTNWWVVPSTQPTVIFLFAGSRPNVTLPLNELATVSPLSGVRARYGPDRYESWAYASTGGKAAWRISLRDWITEPLWLELEAKRTAQSSGDVVISQLIEPKGVRWPIESELSVAAMPRGTVFRFQLRTATLPNQAPRAEILVSRNISTTSRRAVADLNYGSAVSWPSGQEAIFVFRLHDYINKPLRVYRFVALGRRSMSSARRYDWVIEGSRNGQSWHLLDSRNKQSLSQNPASPSAFYLRGNVGFQYYRFRFHASADENSEYGGLAEIEMYPASI